MTLPDAPPTPWDGDRLRVGSYRGECASYEIDARFGRAARVRAQKRWTWCGALTDEVAVGVAIVRTGYAANVFCWVFDRKRRTFLTDISRVVPRFAVTLARTVPSFGEVATFRMLRERCDIVRDRTRWTVIAVIGEVRLDLLLTETASPATAICPTPHAGHLNVTRKQACATATGTVQVGATRFELTDGTGLLDHSHGMLPRETTWRWAIGAGTRGDQHVAFNLVTDFNDQLENIIWLDHQPTYAGHVEFTIPNDPADLWAVRGERVDLTLRPEGVRKQSLNLGVVVSDYAQPLGVWQGTIDGEPVHARGVAELHRSVW